MIREPTIEEVRGMDYVPLSTVDADRPEAYLSENIEVRGVYTADDRLIAIFGAYPAWPGVACVFNAIDQTAVQGNWTLLVRSGRKLIEEAHDTFNAHRVQTYVPLDKQTMRFNDMIGMHAEGIMEGATPDKQPLVVYRHLRGVEPWVRQ